MHASQTQKLTHTTKNAKKSQNIINTHSQISNHDYIAVRNNHGIQTHSEFELTTVLFCVEKKNRFVPIRSHTGLFVLVEWGEEHTTRIAHHIYMLRNKMLFCLFPFSDF